MNRIMHIPLQLASYGLDIYDLIVLDAIFANLKNKPVIKEGQLWCRCSHPDIGMIVKKSTFYRSIATLVSYGLVIEEQGNIPSTGAYYTLNPVVVRIFEKGIYSDVDLSVHKHKDIQYCVASKSIDGLAELEAHSLFTIYGLDIAYLKDCDTTKSDFNALVLKVGDTKKVTVATTKKTSKKTAKKTEKTAKTTKKAKPDKKEVNIEEVCNDYHKYVEYLNINEFIKKPVEEWTAKDFVVYFYSALAYIKREGMVLPAWNKDGNVFKNLLKRYPKQKLKNLIMVIARRFNEIKDRNNGITLDISLLTTDWKVSLLEEYADSIDEKKSDNTASLQEKFKQKEEEAKKLVLEKENN